MHEITYEIDKLILNSDEYKGASLLNDLSKLVQNLFEVNNIQTNHDFLFDDSNSILIKKFISVCFIRLLGVSGSFYFHEKSYAVCKLILNTLPELCEHLHLNSKAQNYQVERSIADFVHQREKAILENLVFNGDLTQIDRFTNIYRKHIYNHQYKQIIHPFLCEIVTKQKLDTTFAKINGYIEAGNELKFIAYQKVVENLEGFIIEGEEINTSYANLFIVSPFNGILIAIKKDFEKSPFNLPSKLTIKRTEKKYPFYKGSKNSINFYVIKDETGYAFDTLIKLINLSSNDIKFTEAEKFIGNIKSNTTIVEFDYEVLNGGESFFIGIEINWTTIMGTKDRFEDIIELIGQKEDLDWEKNKILLPYNLEPIESQTDLIGRENTLLILKSKTINSLGSSYVFGQRRVGKTSIVKAHKNSNNRSDLLIIYIEGGDWNNAQNPFNSMDFLGSYICRKIQQVPKFGSIPIPDFKGSFNIISQFLDRVTEIDSNYNILIILDEFDRISRQLYEIGEIGNSFMLTIRAISNKPQFGFILVGGEKMEFILSQWQDFNKFEPIRVDYFSKDNDWKDFTQLIKKPVENILEITDNAIEVIYNKTNGNPYFTKMICIKLYNLMLENRDTHVTQKEAEIATKLAESSINTGANSFSHFWLDGIKGKIEKEAETSNKRRKILISIANLLKTKRKTTKSHIIDYASEMGLNSLEIEKYLSEFDQRKIIYLNNDEYYFYVLFFQEWLLDGGVDKIISTFEEEEKISMNKKLEDENSIKTVELTNLVERWKIYKGREITNISVRDWLDQFDDVHDQRLVFKILENIKLYDEFEIRYKLNDLYKMVLKQIKDSGQVKTLVEGKRKRDDILVSYLDDNPAKGGSYYTKLFVDSNSIYKDNSCVPNLIENRINELRNLNALVIIDDFIGSGGTMVANITKYEKEFYNLANERGINLIFGIITGFIEAKDKIEKHLNNLGIKGSVFVIDLLNESDKCFSSSSKIFPREFDREKAKQICFRKGVTLVNRYPLGYDDCQATIVFPVNCPNNSLPIFWKKNDNWIPLFERN